MAWAVHADKKQHPYASSAELDEVRAKARAKQGAKSVPYFDETVSTVKSASVLHASCRVGAVLDARADAIEGALMDAARDAVHWLEQHAAYPHRLPLRGHPGLGRSLLVSALQVDPSS